MEYIIPVKNGGVFLDEGKIPSFNLFKDYNITNVIALNTKIFTFASSNIDFLSFYKLGDLYFLLDEDFYLISKCIGLVNWDIKTRFCGYCSNSLDLQVKSYFDNYTYKKVCANCNNETFTSLSPAIIVAILKDEKILLANNINWNENRYSLIAGYCEFGESVIQSVKREIKEETSLEVENIKFLSSQFWPQPHNLMLGFICTYKSGELNLESTELRDAKWFSKEDIYNIQYSKKFSISSEIINLFLNDKLK